jgi:NAD/NADP transhydrogenase beta subunit
MRPRYWHAAVASAAAAAVLALVESAAGPRPHVLVYLLPMAAVSLFSGAAVTLGCGGAAMWKRLVAAAACGAFCAGLYVCLSALAPGGRLCGAAGLEIASACLWRAFAFAVLAVAGAFVTELKLPDPQDAGGSSPG